MADLYAPLNGTLMSSNVGYIFTYANSVTYGMAGLFTVIAFFLVSLLGSLFAQQRFTGRMRPETSFLAASFLSFIFSVILSQIAGAIWGGYVLIFLALTILAYIWSVNSNETPY